LIAGTRAHNSIDAARGPATVVGHRTFLFPAAKTVGHLRAQTKLHQGNGLFHFSCVQNWRITFVRRHGVDRSPTDYKKGPQSVCGEQGQDLCVNC
jgi:hypothetical protein